MTVAILNRAFRLYDNLCINAIRSIINGCDVPNTTVPIAESPTQQLKMKKLKAHGPSKVP